MSRISRIGLVLIPLALAWALPLPVFADPPATVTATNAPAASLSPGQPAAVALQGVVDRGDYVVAGAPDIRPDVRERMLQYLNVRSASFVDANDDGRAMKNVLVTTRFGNAAQLHVLDRPGGARTQITFFDEPVTRAAYVPGSDGKLLLMLRDVGGSEDFQLYRHDLGAGRSKMLTGGKGQHGGLTMERTGKWAAYFGSERNGRDQDIYLVDPRRNTPPKLVLEGTGSMSPAGFSPDGEKLLISQFVSAKVSHLLMLDIASGSVTPVTPPDEPFVHDNGVFSADGKSVYFASDREGEFTALYRRDLATGTDTALTRSLPWDVESVAVSPAGNAVVFTTNEDGISRLYRLRSPDAAEYAPVALPMEGLIGSMGFNRAGTHLCFSLSCADTPGDVYSLRIADFERSGAVERWTYSEMGGLDASKMCTPTRIAYPTFDAHDGAPRTIPAYYYRPAAKTDGNQPFPVVISIHGGPEGQSRPSFSGFVQYLVNEMGVAVIAPNVRGSTGYGRTFHTLDDGQKREDSVRDIGALLDWIARQPELDAKRVAVYGGSYGGYMVLACLTHYPERIKAGIDVVGIANFVTFLERTRDYRRDLRRREYGDESDPEMRKFLAAISPLSNAEKIRSALFVVHGQNDPRVPLYEAEQIVQHMQKSGRPVWYLMAKGEGHGFRKRSNSDLSQVLYAMFLEEHLLK